MRKFFKRAWMGAGYLEGYGYHPGAWITVFLILVAGIAGIQKGGWYGFLGGLIFGTLAYTPFFIIGCVGRAKLYEQDMEQTFKILQKE